jgi:phosphoadenosine phosphosulfate reductase
MQSEFARLKRSHPDLYDRWNCVLNSWGEENRLDKRYIDWGFWRWKRHPPKVIEIARAHGIDMQAKSAAKKEIALQVTRGRSPCGLQYSIEANLSAPQNHPFPSVAGALHLVGDVSFAEDLGAAVVKTEKGRATVFANGHIMIIAPQQEAEELLQMVSETVLRVQMCTGCGICEKNCRKGAIRVQDTFCIDGKLCNRCGKCASGCIAADQAAKIFRSLIAKEMTA